MKYKITVKEVKKYMSSQDSPTSFVALSSRKNVESVKSAIMSRLKGLTRI